MREILPGVRRSITGNNPVLFTLDLMTGLAQAEGMVCGGRAELFIEP